MRYMLWVLTVILMVFALLVALSYVQHPPPTQPWPAGLGTIKDVPARYPTRPMSAGASRLVALAKPLEITPAQHAVSGYVRFAIEGTGEAIPEPSAEVAELLRTHGADLERVRMHLLSGPVIAWPVEMSGEWLTPPNLGGLSDLRSLLCASALDRARRGDAGAWDDLHAAWRIDGSLWNRPDTPSLSSALRSARTITALARKMPAPEPPWAAELFRLDARRAMLLSMQADAWTAWTQFGKTWFPPVRSAAVSLAETDRQMAEWLATYADCSFDSDTFERGYSHLVGHNNFLAGFSGGKYSKAWRDVFRFHAERELTERVFAARRGAPATSSSACIDGGWEYVRAKDGAVTIRYRGVMQAAEKDAVQFPLQMTVRRR